MKTILHWLCRLVLSAVFIYAAAMKMSAPQDFADSIASYRLLPDSIINILALGLPLFEFTCGLLLLSGYHGRTGLLSMIGMLGLFIAAMASAAMRGLPVHCGCFGSHTWLDSSPWIAMARDLGLLLCAIYVYGFYIKKDASVAAVNRV